MVGGPDFCGPVGQVGASGGNPDPAAIPSRRPPSPADGDPKEAAPLHGDQAKTPGSSAVSSQLKNSRTPEIISNAAVGGENAVAISPTLNID